MKSAYVRIYTEEELHRKIQVVRGMIAQMERKMDDHAKIPARFGGRKMIEQE